MKFVCNGLAPAVCAVKNVHCVYYLMGDQFLMIDTRGIILYSLSCLP